MNPAASQRLGPVTSDRLVAGTFSQVSEVASSLVPALCRPRRRELSPLETQWVQFLAPYPWQWFATFTFKDATHPEAADKRFKFWTRLLDDSNGVEPRKPQSSKRRCFWVRGLEWQKREVLHFHALIGNLPYDLASRSQCRLWAHTWLMMGRTGFAKIEVVSSHTSAASYVSKYCAKGGEIDISPNLPPFHLDLTGTLSAV